MSDEMQVKGGKLLIKRDSFLRDERGLKSMPHLIALIAAGFGLVCGAAAILSWFLGMFGVVEPEFVSRGWMILLNIGGGAILAAGGVEGGAMVHDYKKGQSKGAT